jgi:hypothetical protein
MRSDVMGCERPDPIFGGRARAPQITRINSRTMTDSISKNWESIFEDFKDSVSVKINQIFLQVTVKDYS